MELTRRTFLHGAGIGGGTALGGLTVLGADLRPTIARAQELRIKQAKAIPGHLPPIVRSDARRSCTRRALGLRLHGPAECHRVVLRHVGAHDDDVIRVEPP